MKRMGTRWCAVAVLLAAPALYAECTLPAEVRLQMGLLPGSAGFIHYNRGLSFYDFGCAAEAEAELNTAIAQLGTGSALTQSDRNLLALARDALTLTRAQQLLQAGQKSAAIAQLMDVARGTESLIKLRALIAVVPLLDQQSPHWPAVERDLDVLARRGYWQAEKVVAQRAVAGGRAAEAAAHLEQRMAAAEHIHDMFAASTLLADVWRAAGRTLEAWLLIRKMERAAGTDLVEAELRIEMIRVAAEVAGARARAGDDEAKRAKIIYDAALREVTRR